MVLHDLVAYVLLLVLDVPRSRDRFESTWIRNLNADRANEVVGMEMFRIFFAVTIDDCVYHSRVLREVPSIYLYGVVYEYSVICQNIL